MTSKKVYFNYTYNVRKTTPITNSWLIYLLIYIFAGIQANLSFEFFGKFVNLNLLLILMTYLIIQYDWDKIRGFCILIGLVFDLFSLSRFGISVISIWMVGFTLSRIKKAFYVDNLSTCLILLFCLTLGYSLLFSLINFFLQTNLSFFRPFILMFISNLLLSLIFVPVVYPLIRSLLNAKIQKS